MTVKSYEDVINELNEAKSLNEAKLPTISEALDESIIRVVQVDNEDLINDIVDGLQNSERIYKEVKFNEDGRRIEVVDMNDIKSCIYIDSY